MAYVPNEQVLKICEELDTLEFLWDKGKLFEEEYWLKRDAILSEYLPAREGVSGESSPPRPEQDSFPVLVPVGESSPSSPTLPVPVQSQEQPPRLKKNVSGYIHFGKKNRSKIKKSQPDITPQEMTKELAKRWNALSTKQRQRYEQIAIRDKERYLQEKTDYNARVEAQR